MRQVHRAWLVAAAAVLLAFFSAVLALAEPTESSFLPEVFTVRGPGPTSGLPTTNPTAGTPQTPEATVTGGATPDTSATPTRRPSSTPTKKPSPSATIAPTPTATPGVTYNTAVYYLDGQDGSPIPDGQAVSDSWTFREDGKMYCHVSAVYDARWHEITFSVGNAAFAAYYTINGTMHRVDYDPCSGTGQASYTFLAKAGSLEISPSPNVCPGDPPPTSWDYGVSISWTLLE